MSDSYRIYTTKHDRIAHIRDHVLPDAPDSRQVLIDHVARFAIQCTPGRAAEDVKNPVRLLVDLSGSLRGYGIMAVALALQAHGDALAADDVPFEILGFTTCQWKGGMSRKDWVADGRPSDPGRLNDTLHLVIKGMDEPWDRDMPALLLKEGLLKENIDGEAVQWALDRAGNDPEPASLVILSDGAPHDDLTLVANAYTYLNAHYRDVMADAENRDVAFRRVLLKHVGAGAGEVDLGDRDIVTHAGERDGTVFSGIRFDYGYLRDALKMAIERADCEISARAATPCP